MVTTGEKVGCEFSLLTARQQGLFGASRSGESSASEQAPIQLFVEAKRSDLRNGLTRRQRVFILEKLVGLNDKDAALAAGYSLSVAENTKQRIWKPRVRAEWERLRSEVATKGLALGLL
jgi:Terminase small subunit